MPPHYRSHSHGHGHRDIYDYPAHAHSVRQPSHIGESSPPSPLEPGLDRIGDYVARRLVPAILSRSERPLRLVMNFGTLHLSDDENGRAGGRGGNAVVYNAPGSAMTMGNSAGLVEVAGVGAHIGGRRVLLDEREGECGVGCAPGGYDTGSGYVYGYGRRVAICHGCYKRQLVGWTGYCFECDLGVSERVGAVDGVRYLKTPEWLREERELERLRALRERDRDRERERRWSTGYYSDVEREDVRYGSGRYGVERDGLRPGDRW